MLIFPQGTFLTHLHIMIIKDYKGDKMKSPYRELIVGLNKKVPLANGREILPINFDNAATTPPFLSVIDDIYNLSPWYSSIHRGTGYKSVICSNLYDRARFDVLDFVGGDPLKDEVIFLKNTTEGINKLSYRLMDNSEKNIVISTFMEHHSNDLPWRDKYEVHYVEVDDTGRLSLNDLDEKLQRYSGKVKLVAVAGASNVTGYINPIYKIAKLAHKHDSKILVDGAQLVPHHPVDMKPSDCSEHIDYLVFSAHKMYAPFGAGVLIGPKDTFKKGNPEYKGGGTVKIVTPELVKWEDPPYKEEAGTPNIMGVMALISSIRTLKEIGMKNIEDYERYLTHYTLCRLNELPDIEIYSDMNVEKRVSIIPFNIKGIDHLTLARILSYEGGIAVRNGCFCAQPYVQKLLGINPRNMKKYIENPDTPRPGMIRISFGLYNDILEINMFIETLRHIIMNKNYYNRKYSVV